MMSIVWTVIGLALKTYVIAVVVNLSWIVMESCGRKFGPTSTADQVAIATGAKLQGKTVIITGCNSGIGKETAKVLLKCGANVIMACRSLSKANSAKQDILHSLYRNVHFSDSDKDDLAKRICVYQCDLSSLQSVYSFAQNLLSQNIDIHCLINNAGIMALPAYTESTDKYELQFATNHLGHFYLTKLLLGKLKQSSNARSIARIINVSSMGHRFTLALHETIDYCLKHKCAPPKEWYFRWKNYGFTKACNILHANEVNARFGNDVDNVYAVSLHPGVVASNLHQNMSWFEYYAWIFYTLLPGLTKSVAQGAATTVYCACLSDEEFKQHGAQYFKDCKVPFYGASSSCNGRDDKLQSKLWNLSEELIKAKGFKLSL